MSFYRILLNFSSPLRLPTAGRQGLKCAASIGADRLFSFIAIGWTVLFGERSLRQELIDPLRGAHDDWCLSDLFPYFGNAAFLPVALDGKFPEQLIDSFCTSWVSENQAFSRSALAADQGGNKQVLVSAALSRQEKARREGELPFKSLVSTVSAELSQLDSTQTNQAGGASFCSFLRADDDKLLAGLSRVLRFMKDEGFGGMRSFGLGHISSIEIKLMDAVESQKFSAHKKDGTESSEYLILSACVPSAAMLKAVTASAPNANRYKLGKAGGWIYDSSGKHTGVKKPLINFFDTGSRFAVKPEGQLLDLSRNGFPCYRYGIPFTVEL